MPASVLGALAEYTRSTATDADTVTETRFFAGRKIGVNPIMNRFVAAERALRTAAPHELLDAIRAVLADQYGVEDVELFMADYGLTVLQPVSVLPHTMEPVSVHNSPAGRAFGSQQPYREDVRGGRARLHLPVSVRGDRLGVLSVTLPGADAARERESELAEIASVLGHEVMVAERDTDLYLQARRRDRLTLAAEMQWQLLPGRSCSRPEYELGAQLEPAYAIYGDNFDWSATADHLMLYVTNGMGEGIEASLLTNLAINALRNARRAGIPIADQGRPGRSGGLRAVPGALLPVRPHVRLRSGRRPGERGGRRFAAVAAAAGRQGGTGVLRGSASPRHVRGDRLRGAGLPCGAR
ncbi:hypothetical protein RKD37_008364 [Streptomyces ambofaciens]